MQSVDILVQTYLSGVHTPTLTKFMLIVTNIFEVIPLGLIIILVSILIYHRKGFENSLFFVFTIGFGEILVLVSKFLFNVSRPLNGFIVETSKSFPSNHATISTIFFIMLIFFFSRDFKGGWRVAFNTFCVSMIVTVSFSRLYLGVHWLSDVLAGVILGILTVYIATKINRSK
jgi:undecaprenyl-diphosphatase